MKKVLCAILIMGALLSGVSAEIPTHAVGLRFGSATDLTYQELPGPANRIELQLGGGPNWFMAVTLIYKWTWNIAGGLGCYAGPGGQFRVLIEGPNALAFGGQAGVEYDCNQFGWPFLLSFDARPMIGSREYEASEKVDVGINYDFGLSIRYTF